VRAGRDASVADILAHREVVRLIERYNGAFGEFRTMWDDMQRVFGRTPADAPPPSIRPGTVSYNAWLEVRKLEPILRQRRAALEMPESGEGTLSAADDTRLRRDAEFLEHELSLYRDVLRAASDEVGEGVVRSRMDTTSEAIELDDYPDPEDYGLDGDHYWYVRASGDPEDGGFEYQIQRRHDAPEDTPVLRLARDGDRIVLVAGSPSREARAAALVGGWDPAVRSGFERLRDRFATGGARVVPLEGVAATRRTIGSLRRTIAREIENIVFDALPTTLSTTERRRQAREAGRRVAEHEITVVRGTDQLRAYDYRSMWEGEHGEADGDLHHLIPLYLGGDHTTLIDVHPDLHDQLHRLIDGIRMDEGRLAPNSVREADLNFSEGAAVLHEDGSVTLYRWTGGRMTAVRGSRRSSE
jgi:hypothetical protein